MAYLQEALKLVGGSAGPPETSSENAQGHSVAINAGDGTWLAVGNGVAVDNQGELFIFRRDSGGWSEHTRIASPGSGAAFPLFGYSVAISADGHRIVVGSPGGSASDVAGMVYVFDYNAGGDSWAQTDSVSDSPGLGWTVALSHDGTVMAAASHYAEDSTLVYRDSGGGFTLDDTLPGGESVAMSGDGNTVFVLSFFGAGAIYFYNTGWGVQTTVSGVINWQQGSVPFALSYDGSRAAVGRGSGGTFFAGTVQTMTRTGAVWSVESTITLPADAAGSNVLFGLSISSSDDGLKLAIGGPGDQRVGGTHEAIGALWVYTRTGGAWVGDTKKVPTDYTSSGSATAGEGRVFFGASVSITGDAVRVAAGAPDNGNSGSPNFATDGATWVFVGPDGVIAGGLQEKWGSI